MGLRHNNNNYSMDPTPTQINEGSRRHQALDSAEEFKKAFYGGGMCRIGLLAYHGWSVLERQTSLRNRIAANHGEQRREKRMPSFPDAIACLPLRLSER